MQLFKEISEKVAPGIAMWITARQYYLAGISSHFDEVHKQLD